MKAWEIDDLRRGAKGKWLMRGKRQFSGRVSIDSRKVEKGDLFVAIKGERFDAHDFLKDVVAREAAAILVHKEPAAELLALARDADVSVILVSDTVAGLNRLAGAYRAGELGGGFRAKVVAVGGSNGKTTTKRIIHALLAEKFGGSGGGHASPKSFNNNIGMPLTLLEVSPSHEYVVLEIGTNAPGEIAALGEVCRPDIAVITSVGLEHLEKLGDLMGVAREEASIAQFVAAGGTIIIPADTPELLQTMKLSKAQRILVGRGEAAGNKGPGSTAAEKGAGLVDFGLTEVMQTADGTTFSINRRGMFRVPLMGEHNAHNALVAIAVARRLGVSDKQIAAGLEKVKPAEGRFEVMQGSAGFTVVNDAYNANPTSMEAALRTFAEMKFKGKGRKVVVLGDMLELGAATELMHRNVGKQVAEMGFDLFAAIGPNMSMAADVAAKTKGLKIVRFASAAEARGGLKKSLKKGDAILLKGSHSMQLETLLETLGGGNH